MAKDCIDGFSPVDRYRIFGGLRLNWHVSVNDESTSRVVWSSCVAERMHSYYSLIFEDFSRPIVAVTGD
eukprot:9484562-Pyramimonas_sp.AAC.2